MKLPIKQKYFDLIKSGEKKIEYRDAHITFVCEETGETLRKEIGEVQLAFITTVPKELFEEGVLSDRWIIKFYLG